MQSEIRQCQNCKKDFTIEPDGSMALSHQNRANIKDKQK